MSVEEYLIWQTKEKGEGLHRIRPEGEKIEGRGCWGPGLLSGLRRKHFMPVFEEWRVEGQC